MDEIPEGLEDLLNEIRGGGTATASVPTPIKETEEKLVEEKIDPRIIEILGIVDTKDIDYGTYKTLLKEKMVAGRMSDTQMPTEEIELITDEFKRVKGKKGRFKVKGQKIDFDTFMGKAKQAAPGFKEEKSSAIVKAIPRNTNNISPIDEEEEKEEDPTASLVPIVTDLKENMESILDTLEKQFKLQQQQEREEDKLEAQITRQDREKTLEGAKKQDKKVEKKVTKPVKGIFDMLMDFFKNILLGGALLWLMNFLKNPAKILQPLVDIFNNILGFFNGIIDNLNKFINVYNTIVLGTINKFLISPIHTALNFVEDRINDVLKLFGQDPLENIPEEPPELKIPFIPKIPPYDPFEILPEAERKAPPPIEGMREGGIVLNNNNSFGDVNVQTMAEGGKVTGSTGKKVSGMGVDTQMVALQPGEVVMSKPAVQKYGADNLLAMNKSGGGTNVPSFGEMPGFSGGGIVGGTAGSPRNPKDRKIFFHWNGAPTRSNSGPYHQVFNASGKPTRRATYGVDKSSHTGGHNTDSVALGAAALGHRDQGTAGYSDRKGWKENPLTNAQTTAMAKEAAGLMRAYGQTAADVNRNVWTHGEWERYGVKTGKLGGRVQRWDLDSLKPPPASGDYGHPGGFYSTRQVKSKGGDQMRAKVKAFMTGGSMPSEETPEFTKPEGVSATNFNVFQTMSEGQQSRLMTAEVGSKVEGVTVTEGLKSELTKFQMAKADHAKRITIATSQASFGHTGGLTDSSTTIASAPTQRDIPPLSREAAMAILGPPPSQVANGDVGIPPGATPTSVAAGGRNNTLPAFETTDSMNTEMLVIKSMYNLIN